jgi:hypothetical protein
MLVLQLPLCTVPVQVAVTVPDMGLLVEVTVPLLTLPVATTTEALVVFGVEVTVPLFTVPVATMTVELVLLLVTVTVPLVTVPGVAMTVALTVVVPAVTGIVSNMVSVVASSRVSGTKAEAMEPESSNTTRMLGGSEMVMNNGVWEIDRVDAITGAVNRMPSSNGASQRFRRGKDLMFMTFS